MLIPAVTLTFLLQPSIVYGQGVGFNELLQKFERDVVALAQEVERLYKIHKCSPSNLASCQQGNYDHCQSNYPKQECPGGGDDHPFKSEYHIPQCGALGSDCSGLWDFSTSNVALPYAVINETGDPSDPLVIDSVCFTMDLDDWFLNKLDEDQSFWKALGVGPRPMFFGSHTGSCRYFPAAQYSTCGVYDPRVRPWYGAASSGPKTVVLVLDVSSSMAYEDRLATVKEAAKRVVLTLSAADRVALITFSAEAKLVELENGVSQNGLLYKGFSLNKNILLQHIDDLVAADEDAGYDSMYYNAMSLAFEVLGSPQGGVDCKGVVLMFTADRGVASANREQVLELARERTEQLTKGLGRSLALLTFSIASTSEAETNGSRSVAQDLACTSEVGVWSKISDIDDVVEGLSTYFLFLAYSISNEKDYHAWTEPYTFAVGDDLGTTVASPVFDRSIEPPVFLGVVGIDITFAALDAALRIDNRYGGSAETIERFVAITVPQCTVRELSQCDIEAFRRHGNRYGASDACGPTNCTASELMQLKESECVNQSDYPTDLWENRNFKGLSFEDRVCCKVGEADTSNECPASGDDDDVPWTIIGSVLGGVAAVGIVALLLVFSRSSPPSAGEDKNKPENGAE